MKDICSLYMRLSEELFRLYSHNNAQTIVLDAQQNQLCCRYIKAHATSLFH